MRINKFNSKPRIAASVLLTIAFVTGSLSIPINSALAQDSVAPIEQTKSVPGKPAAPEISPGEPATDENAEVPEFPQGSDEMELVSLGTAEVAHQIDGPVSNPDEEVAIGAWEEVGDTGILVAAIIESSAAARGNTTDDSASIDVEVDLVTDQAKSGDGPLAIELTPGSTATETQELAVRIPGDYLASQFGADFAARTRWEQSAEDSGGTSLARSVVDPETSATTIFTEMGTEAVTLAAAATSTSSTGAGSFAASPLSEASSWDVSAQTGTFNWDYSIRTPKAAAGPQPSVALTYDSQSVDGKTGSTNNQPSAVGEGWEVSGLGFIERSYVSCSRDEENVSSSGDLCWKNNNATMSFGGHSGRLVRVGVSSEWKLEKDDGTRVQRITGANTQCVNSAQDNECWKVTTPDGTQYFFGKNQLTGWATGDATTKSVWTVPVFGNDASEPCHKSTFATSSCSQAWRWNLDYVVDVHDNAQALFYFAETNKYARNGTTAVTYTRGGQVGQIRYGFKDGNVYNANAATAVVSFGYNSTGRCVASGDTCSVTSVSKDLTEAPDTPAQYKDVPWDQLCSADATKCDGRISPTFWTDGMLNTITTKVLLSGAYATVDLWTLGHSFPATNDGTSEALWLTNISHEGTTSAAVEPLTVFAGVAMHNRVWTPVGRASLNKYRLSSIRTSLGARIAVAYSAEECSSEDASEIFAELERNHRRCFPQWWSPDVTPAQAPVKDLFHKYVVTSVSADPRTGGGRDEVQQTQYVYLGSPSWRYETSEYIPTNRRTWSDYAGYDEVEVRVGTPSQPTKQRSSTYTFYQGMDGDRATDSGGSKDVHVDNNSSLLDSLWFAGRTYKVITRNGSGGATVATTKTTPVVAAITAENSGDKARLVSDAKIVKTERLADASTRTSTTTHSYDEDGFEVSTGLTTEDAGDSCTIVEYASANNTKWIRGLRSHVTVFSTDCNQAASADYRTEVLAQTRLYYDNGSLGASANLGNLSRVDVVDEYTSASASSAHWVTSKISTFDSMGRPTSVKDTVGNVTSTSYIPAAGAATAGLIQSVKTTGPAPFNLTDTTTYDVRWAMPTSSTDANGKKYTATYDGLGRVLKVWAPDRPQAANPSSPTVTYSYLTSVTVANATTTTRLGPSSLITEFELSDGLGRVVQSQSSAEGGGAAITDTAYNSLGEAWSTNNPYWTASVNPSTVQFIPNSQTQIPSESVSEFDGAGRVTGTVLNSLGSERFRTTVAYPGADLIRTTPADGATPTSRRIDALGRTTQLIEHLGASTASGVPTRTTAYTYDGQDRMTSMVDPEGNAWTWKFDARGNLIKAVDPDTGESTTTYDVAGHVNTTTDGRGTKLAYSYDGMGRVVAKYEDSVGAGGKLLATWVWDTLAKGQLTSSTSYVDSTAGVPGAPYTKSITGYDDGYRPTGASVAIPSSAPAFGGSSGTTYSKELFYNQAGQLNFEIMPAQGGLAAETLQTTYNALGRASGLLGTSAYANVAYTPIGRISQYSRNGTTSLTQSRGYDQGTGAVTNIQETASINNSFSTLLNRVYHYDDSSNVTSIDTTGPGSSDTECFTYDSLQNLTEAWTPSSQNCAQTPSSALAGPAPYWKSYEIDSSTGNRLSATEHAIPGQPNEVSETYDYGTEAGTGTSPTQPHAVRAVTKTVAGATSIKALSYDLSGNTVTRPGQTLEYNASGNLSKIEYASGGAESFIYDADGQLLIQSSPTDGTTLYLGDTELKAVSASGAVTATRTYSIDGVPVAQRTTKAGSAGSVLTWLSADKQGTVAVEVRASTGVAQRRYLDPFGIERGLAAAWSSTHGYLNAPYSAASGLTHLGAREYDSTLGRFTSVDPVLEPFSPQQNNGYSYSQNNPVTLSDPMGTRPVGQFDKADNSSIRKTSGGSKPSSKAPGASINASAASWVEPLPQIPSVNWGAVGAAIGAGAAIVGGAILQGVETVATATAAAAATTGAVAGAGLVAVLGGIALSLSGDSAQPTDEEKEAAATAAAAAAAAKEAAAAADSVPHFFPTEIEYDAATVEEELEGLEEGSDPTKRLVETEQEVKDMFEKWTKGATKEQLITAPKGTVLLRWLVDGTKVQLRSFSNSNKTTIDIFLQKEWRLHYKSKP